MTKFQAAIAVTRFGLGARHGEINDAISDPKGWLSQQIKSSDVLLKAPLGSSMNTLPAPQEMRAMVAEEKKAAQKMRRQTRREILRQELQARSTFAVETAVPFAERWVRFWSNHFTVSARKPQIQHLVGKYEREAIRPNVFGSFGNLLEVSILDATMVLYLDNDRSLGPNSAVGKVQARKGKNRGLNENLAREVLELHTLGVDGGYQQKDVENFSKALTGWTIERGKGQGQVTGGLIFRPRFHEPGSKVVLGKEYEESGQVEAKNILKDLGRHPSTATHIAEKLVTHFVADVPPRDAVETMSRVFRNTNGNLAELAKAILNLDVAWLPQQQKFKTPNEFLISTGRAFGSSAFLGQKNARNIYRSLGQLQLQAPSPAGWGDSTDLWAGPDAIKKRVEWSNQAARRAPENVSASAFLDQALGALATSSLQQAVARAESNRQALILALMSPEFQRR